MKSVSTITSTWKPRVLHHEGGGCSSVRMHVKVGVGVGGDLTWKVSTSVLM